MSERDEAVQLLLEEIDRMRFIHRAAGAACWEWDVTNNLHTWSDEFRELHRLPLFVLPSLESWLRCIVSEDRERIENRIQALLGAGDEFSLEYRVRTAQDIRWILLRGRLVRADQTHPVRLVGMALDITLCKAAEEQQRRLHGELSHRLKNVLAQVMALVVQGREDAKSLDGFCTKLLEQIHALGGIHELLYQRQWRGARLQDVLQKELRPHALARPECIRLAGPDVELPPEAALALHSVVHELVTNAAKHGALSVAHGGLEIEWSITEGVRGPWLALRWKERNGPAMTPPQRFGQGSEIIRTTIEHELGGQSDVAFEADGVRCSLRFPMSAERAASA